VCLHCRCEHEAEDNDRLAQITSPESHRDDEHTAGEAMAQRSGRVSRVVELQAKPPERIRTPAGYRLHWRECFACHRDFAVTLPVEGRPLIGLTLDILCPCCHRHREEVLVGFSDRPIYVEAIQRPWIEWQARRVRRLQFLIRATIRIRLGQAWRVLVRPL
jgi:hypothetical protein